MNEERKPKRIRKQDCRIDWAHYPAEDENGNPIIEDRTEDRNEWLIEDCECDEYRLANQKICFRYYSFDYEIDKFKQWMQQENYDDSTIAYWGLERMFNDGWIKSPAFVDWKDFHVFYALPVIKAFINNVNNAEMRVSILTYFIDNAEYILGKYQKKEILPALKNLREIQKEAVKIRKEELAKQKAAQKRKTPKEKPEYILTLEEIIEYVKTKNPESASVIRSMLYDMMLHKEGWNTPATLKKIDAMGTKIVHNGDTIYGDKHVGTQIDSVASKAIGVQEIHE